MIVVWILLVRILIPYVLTRISTGHINIVYPIIDFIYLGLFTMSIGLLGFLLIFIYKWILAFFNYSSPPINQVSTLWLFWSASHPFYLLFLFLLTLFQDWFTLFLLFFFLFHIWWRTWSCIWRTSSIRLFIFVFLVIILLWAEALLRILRGRAQFNWDHWSSYFLLGAFILSAIFF